MKHFNHLALCFALVGIYGLAYLLVPQVRAFGWSGLLFLACPLMHVFMMHDHDKEHKDEQDKN